MAEGSQWVDFANLALFKPYQAHRQLDGSALMFIESPFLGYPTCLILLKWFGGQRHCGRQGQQGGEDQGGR